MLFFSLLFLGFGEMAEKLVDIKRKHEVEAARYILASH